MHRSVLPVLALVAVAGCGSASPAGTGTARTTQPRSAGTAFRGTTTQGQPVEVLALHAGTELKMRLDLTCRDGSTISGATIDNKGHPAATKPGGSFYVQETGRTPASTFHGYGAGTYRWAVAGSIAGGRASGKVAFRIKFSATTCKAVKVGWSARRA